MKVLNEYEYYINSLDDFKKTREHPILLMRYYTAYKIIGDDATTANRLLSDLLTHKDAGKMYCYDERNYGYKVFEFGVHNLDKVIPCLIKNGYSPAITDYNMYYKDAGGWEEFDKAIKKLKENEEKKAKAIPVQTSLFDDPLFWQ